MSVETKEKTWGSWHYLCFVLAHSLADLIGSSGLISRQQYPKYVKAIEWANYFNEDGDHETAVIPEFDQDSLIDDPKRRKVSYKDVSCLDQDVFVAIFTIHEMQSGLWTLEQKDNEILNPVLTHLEKKFAPWFHFVD